MLNMKETTEQFKKIIEVQNKDLKRMFSEGETFTKSIIESGRRELLRESLDKARIVLKKLTDSRLESASTKELAQIYNILAISFKPLAEPLTDMATEIENVSDIELEKMAGIQN